ncbi:MAG: hypothetical protein A2V67_17290 [Deltaproteobacteria bacterium RBG_13_61_14]|nr:MAG: hypothetical protein A2V67_17290 [Deltaproteobacteria bacterium RBG_13_61_14]
MTQERLLVFDASYERMDQALEQVVEGLDLGSWLAATRGKKVWIKPNMLGLFKPEQHCATHPSLVRELVKLFSAAGAEVMVGDNPGVGGYGLNEKVARRTGILAAADGCFRNASAKPKEIEIRSRFFTKMVVSEEMLQADLVINVPKLKTHSLTVLTGAIKNMFGMLIGGCKGQVHAHASRMEEFSEALVDLYQIRPPELTIVDAIMAMEGNGPSAGKLRPLGKIMASRNGVAADLAAAALTGADPNSLHFLRIAQERGLGPRSLAEMDVQGKLKPAARFKLPTTIQRFGFLGQWFNDYFYTALLRPTLGLQQDQCSQCRICADHCPTGAMQMADYPWIDQDKCIRCFCCHELCPENAWEFRGLMRRLSARRL